VAGRPPRVDHPAVPEPSDSELHPHPDAPRDEAGARELFVSCAPGLEPWLAEELAESCALEGVAEAGGVTLAVEDPLAAAARVHERSALGGHVLLRLASFPARAFPQLVGGVGRIDWKEWLPSGRIGLDVQARRSRLYHTGAIAERVAATIEKSRGGVEVVRRRAVPEGASGIDEDPELAVLVRIVQDVCTMSLDLTGVPMHRRGYRLAVGKAPLREDLAAGLLRASGWRPGQAMFDPFAGSGTIVLEAARQTLGIRPGVGRRFALDRLRARPDGGDGGSTAAPVAGAAPLVGSDRNEGAVQAAIENARRAGVLDVPDLVRFEHAALSDAPGFDAGQRFAEGALVSNPPFGRRIAGRSSGKGPDLRALHQTLGRLARERLPGGWHVALLSGDRRLTLMTGLSLRTAFLTTHGGLKVRAMVGTVRGGVEVDESC
jgi:putative N6-adenine-specific DNA methylase